MVVCVCGSSFEEFESVFKRRSNAVPLSKEGFLAACRKIYTQRFSVNKGANKAAKEAVPERWRRVTEQVDSLQGYRAKLVAQWRKDQGRAPVPAAGLKAAFDEMDADGNGFIDRIELEAALNSVGRCEGDECELIFIEVDENSDGKISFEGA